MLDGGIGRLQQRCIAQRRRALGYINKPIGPRQLRVEVERLLRRDLNSTEAQRYRVSLEPIPSVRKVQ